MLCPSHKSMLEEMKNDELIGMLEYQKALEDTLSNLIDGMYETRPILKHIFTETHQRPWDEVVQSFVGMRENSRKALVFVKEEIAKRSMI